MEWKARYSGEGRSGICRCGHSWDDHHLGVVLNEDYRAATSEYYIPQECEFFGFNETGGLDEEGNPHCGRYVDSLEETAQLETPKEVKGDNQNG